VSHREKVVSFTCGGDRLCGVIHEPEKPGHTALVIVVGGPQYRVGSHRQFVLLARHLANAGFAILRFDYRGMGDSSGTERNFEQIGDDIRAAVNCVFREIPAVENVALWGLCDAASAILFYAPGDPRIGGVVLLNPWVRTEQSVANTYLRHYYLARLRDPEFWRQLIQGHFQIRKAARSAWTNLKSAAGKSPKTSSNEPAAPRTASLPDRMLEGLKQFRGSVLLVLSGDDITANEFRYVSEHSREWRRALKDARITRRELREANHTFSRREWRDQVSRWTEEWLRTAADTRSES